MFGLGSLATKIIGALAAMGTFALIILGIRSDAKKDERNRIEGESLKKELEITRDAIKERDRVDRDGPDAARDRMRRRHSKRNG